MKGAYGRLAWEGLLRSVWRVIREPGGVFGLLAAAVLLALVGLHAPTLADSGSGSGGSVGGDVGGGVQASFQGLGHLLGGTSSFALDVSGDGIVVVGLANNASVPSRAFRWIAESGMADIGTLGGDGAAAHATSADGFFIVGRSNTATGRQKGFRWDPMTGIEELPMADAWDVSDDGSVIVAFNLRWKNGAVNTLAPGFIAFAHGVSRDGVVVVGWFNSGAPDPNKNTRAFRWTESTQIEDLGMLKDGNEAIAEAANQDGSVIVGQARDKNGFWQAFRWTPQTGMVDLRTLGGAMSAAFGVSADGSVIVGQSLITSALGSERAFRWTTKNQMEDLQQALIDRGVTGLENWILTAALDASADGTVIVGYGRNPNKQWEAWRAVLPLP